MGKRSAKFLGSQMWRKRDVSFSRTTLTGQAAMRASDAPSGISVIHVVDENDHLGMAYLLRALSHRVHQFE